MANEFGKIYREIYDSSIIEDWKATLVFMHMIVLSTPKGHLKTSRAAFIRRTNVPAEIVDYGLKVLQEPDEDSGTDEFDGKRIVPMIDGSRGWLVVNKWKYWCRRNEGMDEEEKKEKNRERQAKHREKEKGIVIQQDPNGLEVPVSDSTGVLFVTSNTLDKWQKDFPLTDVRHEIKNIIDWLGANPDRAKKVGGAHSWLNGLLRKSNKKAADEAGTESFKPSKIDTSPHNPERHGMRDTKTAKKYCSRVAEFILPSEWKPLSKGEVRDLRRRIDSEELPAG